MTSLSFALLSFSVCAMSPRGTREGEEGRGEGVEGKEEGNGIRSRDYKEQGEGRERESESERDGQSCSQIVKTCIGRERGTKCRISRLQD